MQMRVLAALTAVGFAAALIPAAAPGADSGTDPSPDIRLTNDVAGGYVSNYTMVTKQPYSDAALTECSKSRGRQNEPSVAIDPLDTNVVVGSSNDYCAVYDGGNDPTDGSPIPSGPIWLDYYRSTDGGGSFTSSLVPGYPGDTTPYAARSQVRTASAGDPVLAWDNHGRLFAGSESSGDTASGPTGATPCGALTPGSPRPMAARSPPRAPT